MKLFLTLAVSLVIAYIIFKKSSYNILRKRRPKFINNIKNKFNRSKQIKERYSQSYSNKLLSNPDLNIQIFTSDNEETLLDKANLHKTRLIKFGKSKMNGERFFRGPKGGVYSLSPSGNKKYV